MNAEEKVERLRREVRLLTELQATLGNGNMPIRLCREAAEMMDFLEEKIRWAQEKLTQAEPPAPAEPPPVAEAAPAIEEQH